MALVAECSAIWWPMRNRLSVQRVNTMEHSPSKYDPSLYIKVNRIYLLIVFAQKWNALFVSNRTGTMSRLTRMGCTKRMAIIHVKVFECYAEGAYGFEMESVHQTEGKNGSDSMLTPINILYTLQCY